MYVAPVPNRSSSPAVLLRSSYCQGGKVRKHTLANLSKWIDELVEAFRVLPEDGVASPPLDDAFRIASSRPPGHIAAIMGTARRLAFERMLDRKPSKNRSLAAAMVLARIFDAPASIATSSTLLPRLSADPGLLEQVPTLFPKTTRPLPDFEVRLHGRDVQNTSHTDTRTASLTGSGRQLFGRFRFRNRTPASAHPSLPPHIC